MKKIISILMLAVLLFLFVGSLVPGDWSYLAKSSAHADGGNWTFYSQADTQISDYNPNATDGTDTVVYGGAGIYANPIHDLFRFDAGYLLHANISSAILHLRYNGYADQNPVGRTYWVYDITTSGFVETQASWNKLKTTQSWSSPGGDYSLTDAASAVVPASSGWVTWDITSIVQAALNWDGIVDLLMSDQSHDAHMTTMWYTHRTGYAPYLVITYTEGLPLIEALDATDILGRSATLNGHCISDGGNITTATFYWSGAGQEGSQVYGNVTDDEYFQLPLTDLIPSNWYVYWIVVENSTGTQYSNLIHFETGATSETEAPIAETNSVSNLLDTSVRLNGRVRYDGGLDCVVGFQYRVDGSSTWIDGWNPTRAGLWRTDEMFSGDLTNLLKNTAYEYRAQVKNAIGTGYGNTTHFTTKYAVAPTPTGGSTTTVPGIPNDWLDFFRSLADRYKLIIALGVTVGSMIFVGVKTPRSKATNLLVMAIGGACVMAFTAISWYPSYLIILIAGVIGLGILLTLAGRGRG